MDFESRYIFSGTQQRRNPTAHLDSPKHPEPYVASQQLVQAVNLAIYLRRPLLLEGEAGCGKTRLASAVAYELGLPFYAWYVRSTSRAQDGLYTYDTILRLHDVQTRQIEDQSGTSSPSSFTQRDPRDPRHYRQFGPLGMAFQLRDLPAVVLIDEIDKADIDFPNDLLAVLDQPWSFAIPETGEQISAYHKPIVIITSNKEKGNLPAPFLRRCIYYYVEFPDEQQLKQIIDAHYQLRNVALPPPELIATATERFFEVRDKGDLYKKPGTSEFLDWLEALRNFTARPFDAAFLREDNVIPYPELLFKLRADLLRYMAVL
jgi:MoxR-like ATPase